MRGGRLLSIRNFRCISLTIDDPSNSEISIKGLTSRLMAALKDWKTRGAPVENESDDESLLSLTVAESGHDDDLTPLSPRFRSVNSHTPGDSSRSGDSYGRRLILLGRWFPCPGCHHNQFCVCSCGELMRLSCVRYRAGRVYGISVWTSLDYYPHPNRRNSSKFDAGLEHLIACLYLTSRCGKEAG